MQLRRCSSEIVPRGQLEGAAVATRGDAARFLHQQHAGRGVPGMNLVGPVPVEPAAGDVGQIERRRARAANRLAQRRDAQERFQVGRLARQVARESSPPAATRRRSSASVVAIGCAVEPRPAARRGGKAFVVQRDRRRRPPAVARDGRPRRTLRSTGIRGRSWSCRRADRPPSSTRGRVARRAGRLFAQDAVIGKMAADHRANRLFRSQIGVGHQVVPALWSAAVNRPRHAISSRAPARAAASATAQQFPRIAGVMGHLLEKQYQLGEFKRRKTLPIRK